MSGERAGVTIRVYGRSSRTLIRVGFATAFLVAVALLVGLPLLIIGLAALGPAGWITAVVILPLATLASILWLGRARPGDGEPPERD
jgi:hypothetical protein